MYVYGIVYGIYGTSMRLFAHLLSVCTTSHEIQHKVGVNMVIKRFLLAKCNKKGSDKYSFVLQNIVGTVKCSRQTNNQICNIPKLTGLH